MNLKFRLINLFMFLLLLGPGNGLFFAMSLAGTSSTASQVVLTVEHEDKQTHLTVLSKFTLADLMLLPATKFTTSTIWTAASPNVMTWWKQYLGIRGQRYCLRISVI